MLEVDEIKHTEMKVIVTKEYIIRVRKILRLKLNGGNTINAMNLPAVAVIRYGAGIRKRYMLSERDNIKRRHYTVNLREQLNKLMTRMAGIG